MALHSAINTCLLLYGPLAKMSPTNLVKEHFYLPFNLILLGLLSLYFRILLATIQE